MSRHVASAAVDHLRTLEDMSARERCLVERVQSTKRENASLRSERELLVATARNLVRFDPPAEPGAARRLQDALRVEVQKRDAVEAEVVAVKKNIELIASRLAQLQRQQQQQQRSLAKARPGEEKLRHADGNEGAFVAAVQGVKLTQQIASTVL